MTSIISIQLMNHLDRRRLYLAAVCCVRSPVRRWARPAAIRYRQKIPQPGVVRQELFSEPGRKHRRALLPADAIKPMRVCRSRGICELENAVAKGVGGQWSPIV